MESSPLKCQLYFPEMHGTFLSPAHYMMLLGQTTFMLSYQAILDTEGLANFILATKQWQHWDEFKHNGVVCFKKRSVVFG